MSDRDPRYERKFVERGESTAGIEAIVRAHPARFREEHRPRYVNNVYFDTPTLTDFFDHIAGVATRRKVRARWYGDTFGRAERPVLEFKLKSGLVGDKELHPLDPISLEPGSRTGHLPASFGETVLRDPRLPARARLDVAGRRPVLLNSYYRRYYRSAEDGRFRVTIDSDLRFWPMGSRFATFPRHMSLPGLHVVEIKYPVAADDRAGEIAAFLDFRLARNSKYVTGIELCYGPLD